MNCSTIDSILDDHGMPRLSPAERQAVASHLEQCDRCAGALAADEALAGETIAEPPPELFVRVVGQLGSARIESRAARRRRRLLASAAAIVVVALAAGYATLERGRAADVDTATAAVAPAPRFVAGRDYAVLSGAAPLAAAADGVPVTEFFMYRCFPCYALEPELERFRDAAPGRVALTRVPAVFSEEAELHARAFYTAESLGVLDAMHAALYDQIHVRGDRLASRAALAELFARLGVDGAAFAAAFDSPRVDASLQRALSLSREYGIEATPTLVVAGRYATNPEMAGADLLAVVDELVAAEAATCQTRCDGNPQRRNFEQPRSR